VCSCFSRWAEKKILLLLRTLVVPLRNQWSIIEVDDVIPQILLFPSSTSIQLMRIVIFTEKETMLAQTHVS
jgi:hypothetical protein